MSLSLQIPVVGNPDSTEDPKIASNFTAISTWAATLLTGYNGRTGSVVSQPNDAVLNASGTGPGIARGIATFGSNNNVQALGSIGYALGWNAITVTHGLGGTPAAVVASALNGNVMGDFVSINPQSFGPTTFQLTATAFSGPGSSSGGPVAWIAVL